MNRLLAFFAAFALLLGAVSIAEAKNINGSSGNNVLVGTNGRDVISGGRGNDTIDGRSGNDTLLGGSGNDKIIGGPGRDVISTGSGNDTVYAKDGEVDRIVCGKTTGKKTIYADPIDKIDRSCR